MSQSIKGLGVKPTYEDLIGVAVSDKLFNIKFPNRDATFLRNGFVLSQLDGEGMRQMEKQQEMASKESYKEHLLKEIAKNTGANIHDLRNDNHDDMRRARVDSALYFDMSQGDGEMADDMDVSQTNEAGVQTQTQTNESGAQTMRPRLTKSTGAQAEPRVNTKETQATEDRSEEIEKIKRASELEKQALEEQHKNNIERVRQQVRAEAEALHESRRQEYQQEAMEKANITEAEAQRRIQQINQTAQQRAQESARQEAQSYVGNVMRFAETKHQSEMEAAKEQAEKEATAAANKEAAAKKEAAAEVAKAKKEAKEAKEQTKKSSTIRT